MLIKQCTGLDVVTLLPDSNNIKIKESLPFSLD